MGTTLYHMCTLVLAPYESVCMEAAVVYIQRIMYFILFSTHFIDFQRHLSSTHQHVCIAGDC